MTPAKSVATLLHRRIPGHDTCFNPRCKAKATLRLAYHEGHHEGYGQRDRELRDRIAKIFKVHPLMNTALLRKVREHLWGKGKK